MGNRIGVAFARMTMMTGNPNPEPRILDWDTSTGLNRGQMRPPPTINRQPAPSRGLRTTANRQSLIPIPSYRTAPLPCALWPSASGSVAVTSHAKPGAKAGK